MATSRDRKSLRLVIDTSITSAASERPSPDPTGRICARLLRQILEICHRVVFTEEALGEWRGHRSRFALTWRRAMTARKKLITLGEESEASELRAACDAIFGSTDAPEPQLPGTSVAQEVEKDFHLIEAALATDGVILSRDRRIRDLLAWACTRRGARELENVVWIHPRDDGEHIAELLDGKPPRACRLGSRKSRLP